MFICISTAKTPFPNAVTCTGSRQTHFLAEATTQPTTIVEPRFGPRQSGLEVSALSLNPRASLCRGFVLWVLLLLFSKSGSCYTYKVITVNAGSHWRQQRERAAGGSPFLGLFVCVTPDRPGFMVRRTSLISSLDPELNEPVLVDKHATTTSKWALSPHGSATLCQLWMIPERNACFRVSKRTSRTF